jgi:hypothetical protein
MNVSRTIAILLLLSACLVSANGEAVRFDGFEGRRPIKYFFHLLELKSGTSSLLSRLQPAPLLHDLQHSLLLLQIRSLLPNSGPRSPKNPRDPLAYDRDVQHASPAAAKREICAPNLPISRAQLEPDVFDPNRSPGSLRAEPEEHDGRNESLVDAGQPKVQGPTSIMITNPLSCSTRPTSGDLSRFLYINLYL